MSRPVSPRIQMSGICKAFAGVSVLRDVDLTLNRGEVLALLGSNGAGKSTLVKILCGAYTRDGGDIRVDGKGRVFASPSDAVASGIRFLPQEVSVFPDLPVSENILLSDLPVHRVCGFDLVDRKSMHARALALLHEFGLKVDPRRRMGELSVSEQRVVEIARAVAGRANVLVMDEPTAALTAQEVNFLFDVIRRLRAGGVSVIYISHYLDEVFRISDRITVLRDGRNAGVFATSTASVDTVVHAMLGTDVANLYPAKAVEPGPPLLDVRALDVRGKLHNIAFEVRRGEIVGAFGLIGSGVEVLGRGLYGSLGSRTRADVQLDGRPYYPSTPEAAKRRAIGFVAAERKREGIIADLSVRDNISLPFLRRFGSAWFVSKRAERREAERWISRLSIRTQGVEQEVRLLSGGNQQKVCIARWLVDRIDLLILEEPTRGVDIGARREIYAELRHLADAGLGLLVVSTDAEEIAGLTDRSLVLERGHLVASFGRDVTAAALMAVAGEASLARTGGQTVTIESVRATGARQQSDRLGAEL